ncbi:uncharacterized protein LOC141586716 isoform X1 [Silene latifolia]|uniref:uncharacterized protein LOC141586716 isoform X1 n=1 Tax=Silene latifolia TaxID=37657 RepID=UPI003D788075
MVLQGKSVLKWGCSYKRITLSVCSINIVVALYVLHGLYSYLYVYSSNSTTSDYDIKYTPDQINKMEESLRIRKASEPVELIKVVKNFTSVLAKKQRKPMLSMHLKLLIRDDILLLLRSLPENASLKEQRETVETWRSSKLNETNLVLLGENDTSYVMSTDEAALLVEALQSKWSMVMEEIGLWIPPMVNHEEHDDKPLGIDEFEDYPLAGRPVPPECHTELHTDYGGAAVKWGLSHHKESAADCCQACLDQANRAKPGQMKCNIWVYCPSETGCYSPDKYEHKHQECWLKYAEQPKVNFKDKYSESYRSGHPTAPLVVPWVSGVVAL